MLKGEKMRLIDADALLEDVRKHSASYFADDFAKEWVDKQPTVDAVPVRRGKWISTDDGWDGEYFVCSECGCPWTLIEGSPKENGMNFCPNCGARMEESDG